MKVLLVTKGLDLGGQERVVSDLAIGLQQRGLHMTVAVVNDARQWLTPRLIAAGVEVIALGGTDRVGVGAARRLREIGAGHVADGVGVGATPDVVHVHSPLPACFARLGAGSSTRVVTTLHTPWPALHPLTRWAWRATAHRDHTLVAVSSAVAVSLPRSLGERASVIPHGIDVVSVARAAERRADTRASLRDELAIPADRALVVTVASHRRAKNYPNLLSAFRAVLTAGCDAHLIAIGTGEEVHAHRALADTLGLVRNVTFLPPRDDVLSVLAAADVVAMSSDYEGQPLVVLEALALGRPIVATAVGRVPELVPTAAGRVVPPNDPFAFGAALVDVLSDAELRKSMSAEAVRSHEAASTLDDALDAHVSLYEGVLAARNGGRR